MMADSQTVEKSPMGRKRISAARPGMTEGRRQNPLLTRMQHPGPGGWDSVLPEENAWRTCRSRKGPPWPS